jgi:hypothetical protein
MAMDDVKRIYRGWQESPPTHWIVKDIARGLGIYKMTDSPEAEATRISTESEIDAFFGEVNVHGRR